MISTRRYNTEHRSCDLAWELIFEELQEARYENAGPESYDRDYRNDLVKHGLWDNEVASWTPPTTERGAYLRAYMDGLEKAMSLCQAAINKTERRMAEEAMQYRPRNYQYY